MSPAAYTPPPSIRVFQSKTFDAWFSSLRDRQAKERVAARIRRLSLGNPGDVRPVGSGVSEMRVDCGPGYRVYFKQRGATVVHMPTSAEPLNLQQTGRDRSWQPGNVARRNSLPMTPQTT